MRCFVAVKMPVAFSRRVSGLSNEFKDVMHFRQVKAENMHITLFFFGQKKEGVVEDIKKTMDKLTFSPFEIFFNEVGFFGSRNFPKVVFLKGYSDYLLKIHNDMKSEFQKSGIHFDEKPFKIHLTLLRVKKLYDKDAFLDKINNINKFFQKERLKFDAIYLIKSNLTPKGPVYETIYRKSLV
ncbi:MAG: RNA 2',3'-cyclic phosphodiesterase [Flexistipes sinusarabici]|uniref:RNA 2',3'-cyclic phosphodiesterase n=1 Tax=Flexistipes sinusarabici TaxID=2352 RepID=A0A5D0MKZ0_FLESI|nr:RNA 2',3'-cyclic phosphodiesterase [Flexistipes sinusarabici]TYB32263.1 MAG: RNA 2',3'-cyclic phosphodiesterase [Flexistipes sinusarabici]